MIRIHCEYRFEYSNANIICVYYAYICNIPFEPIRSPGPLPLIQPESIKTGEPDGLIGPSSSLPLNPRPCQAAVIRSPAVTVVSGGVRYSPTSAEPSSLSSSSPPPLPRPKRPSPASLANPHSILSGRHPPLYLPSSPTSSLPGITVT